MEISKRHCEVQTNGHQDGELQSQLSTKKLIDVLEPDFQELHEVSTSWMSGHNHKVDWPQETPVGTGVSQSCFQILTLGICGKPGFIVFESHIGLSEPDFVHLALSSLAKEFKDLTFLAGSLRFEGLTWA